MKDAPVMIIKNKNNEFLLLKRTPDHKLFPNEWCLPGGKRELSYESQSKESFGFSWKHAQPTYSESNEEAIYRECEEELGCKIHVFEEMSIHMIDDHYKMKVYVAATNDITITKEFPNREHVTFGWFDVDNLPKELSKITRELLETYEF